MFKIENRNRECVKETTTQPESKKQPKSTNGFSTHFSLYNSVYS